MNIGKKIRMQRILNRENGRTIIVPLDHGISAGPMQGIQDMHDTVSRVAEGGINCVVMHKGMTRAGSRDRGRDVGLLIHLSASTGISPRPNSKVLVGTVEDALRLGADGVSVHVNLGDEDEGTMLADLGRIASEADVWGMPVLAMIYARGPKVSNEFAPDLVAHCARVGAELGADIIKVGIGPGSVCTTRIKTGVGYPQLSAIIECADAAHGLGGHIISDGGCKIPGDVAKAFGGGSDFVMLGGMFAGHDESGGEIVEENGKKFRLFYGMSSQTAMDKHSGGVAEYRASEGKTVKVAYKGAVSETVKDILGGVRSTCTYVGASQLRELSKRTTFIRVAEQENQVFGD